MAALGYIEILDAKGNVTERVRIDSLPVHIGRAYSNHVVVDDPYVCPAHLTIEQNEQGDLIARDLESVNGLYASGRSDRVATLALRSGTQFRIGHTSLRFRSVEHPLAPTLVDRGVKESHFASPHVAAFIVVAVLLLLCLESYLGIVERVTFAKVVSEPLTSFSMLLVWAGLWALASRIVVSHFYYSQHAMIACGAIIGFSALNVSSEAGYAAVSAAYGAADVAYINTVAAAEAIYQDAVKSADRTRNAAADNAVIVSRVRIVKVVAHGGDDRGGVVRFVGRPLLLAQPGGHVLDAAELLARILAETQTINGFVVVADDAGIHWNGVRAAAGVIKYLEEHTTHSEGNFHFAAGAFPPRDRSHARSRRRPRRIPGAKAETRFDEARIPGVRAARPNSQSAAA